MLELVRRQEEGSFALAYATLAFAFVAESISLVRAVVQTRGDAAKRNLSFLDHVRRTTEPAAKTVLYEDTVAVTGVLVAALGIGLHQLTGNVAWDGAAAIVVGVILVWVAVTLGRNFRALLIGAGAPPDERERLRDVLSRHEDVSEVLDLRTMYVGPGALLVAARIDLAPGIDSEGVEELSSRLDRELRDAVGDVRQVFLDPTARNGPGSRLGGRRRGSGSSPTIDTKEGAQMANEEQHNQEPENEEQQQDEASEQGGGGSTARSAAVGAAAGAALGAAAGAATSAMRGGEDDEQGDEQGDEQKDESSEQEGEGEQA